MQTKRHSDERGSTTVDWLESMHSFSFGNYHDSAHMGFSHLRVINEDHVVAGAGFGIHSHDNMEIISYVLSGALAHKDNMGNESTIRHGDVQVMSAGTGVAHSEFNGSDDEPVHFLQMWIIPNMRNEAPNYQEKSFNDILQNRFVVVASQDGQYGSLLIRQDARLLIGHFDENMTHTLALNPLRKAWVQIASGRVKVNGEEAQAGDGFALEKEHNVTFGIDADSEILVFDLA